MGCGTAGHPDLEEVPRKNQQTMAVLRGKTMGILPTPTTCDILGFFQNEGFAEDDDFLLNPPFVKSRYCYCLFFPTISTANPRRGALQKVPSVISSVGCWKKIPKKFDDFLIKTHICRWFSHEFPMKRLNKPIYRGFSKSKTGWAICPRWAWWGITPTASWSSEKWMPRCVFLTFWMGCLGISMGKWHQKSSGNYQKETGWFYSTVWTGTVTSVSEGIALKLLRGGWTAQQMLENVEAFRARSHFQARKFSSQDRTENDDSKLLWSPKILWFPRSSNLNLCPCTVNPAQIEAGWAMPRSDHWRLTWYPSSDSPWVIHCNIPSYPFGCWLDLGVTPKGDQVVAGEISPVWFLMVH